MIADMPIQKAAVGSAVASDDRIFFGSSDGHLYAMRWTDPRTNVAVMLWRVMSGGPPSGAPVLINQGDDLVFASQGGSVYSCTAPTKILNWRAQTNGPIIAQVAVDGPGVFAASADRSLYRFNLISGAQEWRARFPEPLNDGPVVTGGIVFQYCAGEGIIALDAERGEPLWQQREARQFVCRGIEHVVLITELRELLKVDVNSGNVRARVRLPSNAVTVTNVHDDTIYLVSHAGSVFCAKPSGTPHLTPEQMAVARRELRDPDPRPSGARAVEMPPRRPDEPGVIDPADPLRSPGDRGEQSPE
jgi:outer membrane protein assembly factor BamB